MSSRTIVIVIALVIAGFTLVSLRDYFTQAPVVEAQAPAPVAQRVLVAKRNLSSGSFVQAEQDLDWQPLPEAVAKVDANQTGDKVETQKPDYQYEGAVNIDSFNGAVVRRQIRAGEPILPSMIMRSGEGGFMSAVLEPGKRAVSISVNPISGNAGFVSPGDRVDLLITYHMKLDGNDGGNSIATETFIRNVRVLAVDQSLDNPENKAILAKTITVEVSPNEAEKISVAADMGKISLSLVSTAVVDASDKAESKIVKGASNSKSYTMGGDVSNLMAEQGTATKKVRIIRGDRTETLEFYQDKQ